MLNKKSVSKYIAITTPLLFLKTEVMFPRYLGHCMCMGLSTEFG